MLARLLGVAPALLIASGVGTAAFAQETTSVLAMGESGPDFELTGATRFGILKDPIRLSDFHGKTIVLAFFYRARTPG